MRNMKTLMDGKARIWFYLKDEATKKRFIEDAVEQGCRFLNGDELTIQDCSHIMSIHADKKVAHVAIFIWNASFQGAQFAVPPLKVDYARYIDGNDDWACKKSDFIPVF